MIKFSELKSLSVDDIDLILKDQKDLYSQEEIAELKEFREYLVKQGQKAQANEKQSRRLKTIICPKCDGENDSSNTHCTYCGYKFKESDCYAPKQANEDNIKDDTALMSAPSKRLFGLLFAGGGIGSIIYGCVINDSIEAQLESIWNNGTTDPGTPWIIIGVVTAVVGAIMLGSVFFGEK